MIKDTPTLALSIMISVGTFAQVKVLNNEGDKIYLPSLNFRYVEEKSC